MLKAVLFDLDGTLADTARDLAGALNDLLRAHQLPEKDVVDIRPYAAQGASALIAFGLQVSPEHPEFAQYRQAYLTRYEQRLAQETVLFDNVNTVLNWLQQQHILWGIVTNKHACFTDKLLPQLHFATQPDIVVSGDTCSQPKPAPDSLLYACQKLNILPENCLYIGDGERDIQASKQARMPSMLALWGYICKEEQPQNWQADYVARDMLDVLRQLQKMVLNT